MLILVCSFSTTTASTAKPEISAQCAVLLERNTGRVLYARNPHAKRPIASTTKIMTAIIAIEKGNYHDVIKVSEKAAAVEGSSIWLEAGEEKTLEELLYGLILRSGNDAAVAIAEYIGGSVEKFSHMMTEKAYAIGAVNSSFKNPHGLDQEGHYSTAYDLALIMSYGLKNSQFVRLMTTREKVISWPGYEWDRILRNQNRLLDNYPGADSGKTGWTTPAGRCYVGSATREGMQLVAVVLNASNMWEDAMALLDFGFENFEYKKLIKKEQYVKSAQVIRGKSETVDLITGDSYFFPLKVGEENNVRYYFDVEEPFLAPVTEGELLGELKIYYDGDYIEKIPLLARHNVDKKSIFRIIIDFLKVKAVFKQGRVFLG